MLSISPASGDSSYYGGSENYYDHDALGEAVWFGKAAEAMGLRGAVDPAQFDRLSDGRLADGTVLGRGQGENREHKSGWDLTFSAPKSVSIMALAGGDKDLIDAVQEAAKDAVTWVEEAAAKSRFFEFGKVTAKATGNLAVAMYTHDLSRAQEPQLHVHGVVMNATRGPRGEWRSLDSQHLYWRAKEAGLRFQQALALRVRHLGYEIEVNTRQGTFEISGIPRRLIDTFSTRSKQILAELAKAGLTRETATRTATSKVAVETRAPKEQDVDRAALARSWQRTAKEQGIDLGRVRSGDSAAPPATGVAAADDVAEKALDAARNAARALAERQVVFSQTRLIDRAARYATGFADRRAIGQAVERLEQEGFLLARETAQYDRAAGDHIRVQGWTTAEAQAIERDVRDLTVAGRDQLPPVISWFMASRIARNLEGTGGDWSEEHASALFGLLSCTHRVVSLAASLDGRADRKLIDTYLDLAAKEGFEVQVLTPSAGMASALTRTLEQPVATVASHLSAQWQRPTREPSILNPFGGQSLHWPSDSSPKGSVWLVAGADHLRPSAARDLLRAAAHKDAQIVLLADSGQTETNPILRPIRASYINHYQLPAPPAQDRNQMHLAVAAMQRGDPLAAFDHIREAGGQIVSIGAASRSLNDQKIALADRRAYIADRYASLDRAGQERTRVLELTERGRQAMNAAIRERLVADGTVAGPTLRTTVLVPKSMTRTEREQAVSYAPGDVVRFGSRHQKAAGRPAIAPGDLFKVASVEAQGGKVTLSDEHGRQFDWQPREWGAASASTYRQGERDFAAGDRIVWTRSDKRQDLKAQQADMIVNVHPETGVISVERDGSVKDVNIAAFKHLDHAYADRVRAGGKTDHIIAHLPADNVDLTNLRTLTEVARQSRQLTIVTENAARLAQAAEDRPGQPETAGGPWQDVSGSALDAVRTAADILVERKAVFSNEDLVEESRRQGLGRTTDTAMEHAISALEQTGQLIRREAEVIDRDTWSFVPAAGWTTWEAVQDEEKLLAAELRGRDAYRDQEIMSRDMATETVLETARKSPADQPWSRQQMEAAVQLLSSPHRVTALQGLAGTAKTSTVLLSLAKASKVMGHEVQAMAPTTDVARHLGHVLKTDQGVTLAKHLADVSRVRAEAHDKSPVWIVDEASMVSAKDMRNLIRVAEQQGARLFLVFDVLQLGSVGAGRAAGQLIEHGMETAYLDRIVRQADNETLRDAVYDMIGQNPGRALEKVIAAGGTILETDPPRSIVVGGSEVPNWSGNDGKEPGQLMADEYLRRPTDQRHKTIVIDPTREGVRAATAAIRKGLETSGDLTGDRLAVTVLEEAGLTERERATPTSYRPGQLVRFAYAVDLGTGSIPRDSYLDVVDVVGADVLLRDDKDRVHRWAPRDRSLPVEVYEQQERELMAGDRIRWTRNVESQDLISGRRASVVSVDKDSNRIDVKHDQGGRQTIDLGPRAHRHLDHGYAVTMQRAQGATGPVIAHLRSHGLNTVHLASAYGAISRSPGDVVLVTDSKKELAQALQARDGQQEAALDQVRDAAGQAAIKVREMAVERQVSLAQERTVNEADQAKTMQRVIGDRGMER